MIRRLASAALLAAIAVFLSLSAMAQSRSLYGATGGGAATSNLYVLNTTNGAPTVVGAIGFAVTGMAFNAGTGVMYGVTTGGSACSRCLITINLVSGAGTVVGPLGLVIAELEFGANGVLYGWSESSDELASINTTTGAATTIPGSGIGTFGDGMALVGGVMFVMPQADNGTYYTVNTTTGATTAVGTLTGSPSGGGFAVSAASTDPATGVVYAGINSNPSLLVTVNMATGVISNVGTVPTPIDAIAFGPLSLATGVPTMSEWALIALALLMGAAGVLAIRGRGRTAA